MRYCSVYLGAAECCRSQLRLARESWPSADTDRRGMCGVRRHWRLAGYIGKTRRWTDGRRSSAQVLALQQREKQVRLLT